MRIIFSPSLLAKSIASTAPHLTFSHLAVEPGDPSIQCVEIIHTPFHSSQALGWGTPLWFILLESYRLAPGAFPIFCH